MSRILFPIAMALFLSACSSMPAGEGVNHRDTARPVGGPPIGPGCADVCKGFGATAPRDPATGECRCH